MDYVTECPDTAILGNVLAEPDLEENLGEMIEDPDERAEFAEQWSIPRKYYDGTKEKRQRRRPLCHHHRPQQVQGVR